MIKTITFEKTLYLLIFAFLISSHPSHDVIYKHETILLKYHFVLCKVLHCNKVGSAFVEKKQHSFI